MGKRTRLLSVFLATAILLSVYAPAGMALESPPPTATGSIAATLRLDYPQTRDTVSKRKVTVKLTDSNGQEILIPLEGTNPSSDVTVTPKNTDGGELGGGLYPGYYDIVVNNLPQGTYTLRFEGVGYKTYEQKDIQLQTYSQHVVLGTGDATFSLGDVDNNGTVDTADRDAVANALSASDEASLARYDLSGDGKIDIVDLAYLNRQQNAAGAAEVFNTTLLASAVNTATMSNELTLEGGTADDLFCDNDTSVTIRAPQDGTLSIPVPFATAVEMEQIEISSPTTTGSLEQGTVVVEDERGNITTYPFDQTVPEGLHAIGRSAGKNTITISLGNKVAVKKVTISVTKVEGSDGKPAFAVVDTIRFLKDIVPDNPTPANVKVKSVTAIPASEEVTLKWAELPNVSGYRVSYSPENGSKPEQQLNVNVTTATIKGLENLLSYSFYVTPTATGWEGERSDVVTAIPQPAGKPEAPDMVVVKPKDSALDISWKKNKNTTYYEVYYKEETATDYMRSGGILTETYTTISALKNDVPYSVYVVAGNALGKSSPSRISSGTPTGISYTEPKGIPTEGRMSLSNITAVTLTAGNNYDPSQYSTELPFHISFIKDENYRTHWTSQSYGSAGGGQWWISKEIVYTLATPTDMSYLVVIPRMDGNYKGNMKDYTIYAELEGQSDKVPLAVGKPIKNNPAVTGFAVLPFTPTKGIKKLYVSIGQQAYSAVAIAEVMFFDHSAVRDLDSEIAALFANSARTQLKAGVTKQQIESLSAALNGKEAYYLYPAAMKDELTLATELLENRNTGVVLHGITSRNAADDGRYQQGGSTLMPLGVAAKAGQELVVYADIPQGETVTLYATQYFAEANTWQAELGKLSAGRNVLIVPKIGSQNTPRGGSLYYTYSGDQGEQISLNVRRATAIPVLELENWYALNETERETVIRDYVKKLETYAPPLNKKDKGTNVLNVTEISTPTVLLSIPATAVFDHTGTNQEERVQALYNNVLAWEDLMHITKTTQGIDPTYGKNDMKTRQNIRYMQMFANAFMYAAGSHVGIGYGSCGGVVSGKPISQLGGQATSNQLFGWGIAHEIGHNMDKLGKAEITNNLYSLMVQTYDGKQNTLPSRLEGGLWQQIYTKVAEAYPGASNDVFVQLGLYWQLHLAYDTGEAPLDFYNRFFKAWKAGTYTQGVSRYEDKVALTASHTAGKNLTEFFTRWGMQLSDAVKTELAKLDTEQRAIWYLNDDSRRDRVNGTAAAAGTISAQAVLSGDHTVVLSMTPTLDQGKIQGYEILRDGRAIGFTTQTSYTDVIGSANHRAFTYTVRAYDTLGNAIGAVVDAGQIRVAYAKTISEDAYTMHREGETVTVQFNEETAISGIKLTGAGLPNSGAFTVTVTSGADDATPQVAKTGDYAKNEAIENGTYLTYFNKPNTEASDTRIWTYDAKTVVVNNVPDGVNISLVSYAGDDISITAVGRLSADYQYGENSDDVIAKDTLVITGTYRGDPLYNTLRLKGSYVSTALGESGLTQEVTERYMDGYALLFAEIPKDGAVSDISDGIFLFVPNVQQEAALQDKHSNCDIVHLLPSRIMAELFRTDLPDEADRLRPTASTLWQHSPDQDSLPTIVMEGTAE